MVDLTKMTDDELRSAAAMARARVKSKPLTEQQSKYILHGEEMERANKGMDALQSPEVDPQTGEVSTFDPTGYVDGANVAMAGNRLTYPFASEKGQQQDAYNNAFAQALSYGRSMASFRKEELDAAYDTFLPKIGDKPAQAASKKAARDAVTQAVQAGDPRLPQIISKLTGGIDFSTPAAGMLGTPAAGSAPPLGPAAPPGGAPTPPQAAPTSPVDRKARALAAFKAGPDTPERRRMIQELLSD